MTEQELDDLVLSNFTPFDRRLSLAIDACHDRLDALHGKPGMGAWATRLWWRWQLRRLESRIWQPK